MTERLQPVCKGVDSKGELIWGAVPMALWQRAMFPIRYTGDFLAFWLKRAQEYHGCTPSESNNAQFMSNANEYHAKYARRHKTHNGD